MDRVQSLGDELTGVEDEFNQVRERQLAWSMEIPNLALVGLDHEAGAGLVESLASGLHLGDNGARVGVREREGVEAVGRGETGSRWRHAFFT